MNEPPRLVALVGGSLVRPTWSEYFMSIAKVVATRSDCERDQVGAVVVKDNRIRATGYNGAPAGNPGCESCPRRVGGAPPGSDYESGAGLCHAIHAEANALLYCNREDLPGATLYISRAPCSGCSKLIAAVGITDVFYPGTDSMQFGAGDEVRAYAGKLRDTALALAAFTATPLDRP